MCVMCDVCVVYNDAMEEKIVISAIVCAVDNMIHHTGFDIY
jgi:hypothetical protein